MENINEIIGDNLRDIRKQAGLSIEGLARELGVSYQTVLRWENKKHCPNIKQVNNLAKLLDCKPTDFYRASDESR